VLAIHSHLEMAAQRLDGLHHCTQAQTCEGALALASVHFVQQNNCEPASVLTACISKSSSRSTHELRLLTRYKHPAYFLSAHVTPDVDWMPHAMRALWESRRFHVSSSRLSMLR